MYGVENMLPLFSLHEDGRQAEQFIWDKSKIERSSRRFRIDREWKPDFSPRSRESQAIARACARQRGVRPLLLFAAPEWQRRGPTQQDPRYAARLSSRARAPRHGFTNKRKDRRRSRESVS